MRDTLKEKIAAANEKLPRPSFNLRDLLNDDDPSPGALRHVARNLFDERNAVMHAALQWEIKFYGADAMAKEISRRALAARSFHQDEPPGASATAKELARVAAVIFTNAATHAFEITRELERKARDAAEIFAVYDALCLLLKEATDEEK